MFIWDTLSIDYTCELREGTNRRVGWNPHCAWAPKSSHAWVDFPSWVSSWHGDSGFACGEQSEKEVLIDMTKRVAIHGEQRIGRHVYATYYFFVHSSVMQDAIKTCGLNAFAEPCIAWDIDLSFPFLRLRTRNHSFTIALWNSGGFCTCICRRRTIVRVQRYRCS